VLPFIHQQARTAVMKFLGASLNRKFTVGYLAVVGVSLWFIWSLANLLFDRPEFYPGWDQRNFYALAIEAQSKVQSIFAGEPNSWSLSGWELSHQYNTLFALPLVPALIAFGQSWYVYGIATALIYGTAATLTVGALAVVLLAGYRQSTVFLTFAATSLVAVTRSAGWYSTIYYYPDIGDACVLAIWLIGAFLLLRRPNWQCTSVLVLLTILALLFRRALVFTWAAVGIALTISTAIECWVDWRKSDLPKRWAQLRAGTLRISYFAASAIIALGILILPSRSFVREMLSLFANNAYQDYAESPITIMDEMLGAMGIIPLALSAAGYAAGAIVFRRRRFEIIGLGLGAILNGILWITILRETGVQYWVVPGVLFLPVGIGLGLATLAEKLRGRKLRAALGISFLLLLLSAGSLLGGAMLTIMDIDDPSRPHLLQSRLAKVSLHKGMGGPFREIFARLGVPGPQPKKVLVVASSVIFNEAVVQSAGEALLGNMAKSYFFHFVPVLDSRDRLIVTEIIDSDFVLVGDPLQTHLSRGFEGLKAVHDMFLNHAAAALDFDRRGEPIAFQGFSISIFQRIRETNERTALATIEALESAVTLRGYGQPSWIEIGRPSRSEPVDARNDAVVAHNRIPGDGWPARYLSYDTMPTAAVELRGVGETTCPQGALVSLWILTQDNSEPTPAAAVLLAGWPAHQPFSLATVVPASGLRLELEINPPLSGVACDVALEHLKLHSSQF
jgi:hypothetical protein